MKRIFLNILLCLFIIAVSFSSCDFLDIVPDETPTETDAFRDAKAAERYLYSCYGLMQKERLMIRVSGEAIVTQDVMYNMALGSTYTAANPSFFDFWSRNYAAIRRCHLLIENLDKVPNIEERNLIYYKAEAKFLIAYMHFQLLKAYGPIVLADKVLDMTTPSNDLPGRAKFDDCVEFICNLFDEASKDLPNEWKSASYGRATRVAALALKAKTLVYAASPLFNGNIDFYSDLKNPDNGEPLMNLTYDVSKWSKAAVACTEAISAAEAAGITLYYGTPSTTYPEPANPVEFRNRMNFIDPQNNEVIWADTRPEDYYDFQNSCPPRHPEYGDPSWNETAPTMSTVKMFYTENGLPIDEDPTYYKSSEYYETGNYEGVMTAKLNLLREPRFYAWIGFHGGWYEIQRNDDSKIRMMMRKDDPHGVGTRTRNFTLTGYLQKKCVGPLYNTEQGGIKDNYGWPIIRLADLFLLQAEASIESNDLETGKKYLNLVRARAGVPNVEASWNNVANLDQKKLRQIIRQERMIEMFSECQYFWDVRRWKIAEQIYKKNPVGMNITGTTDGDFFKEVTIGANWAFTSPRNYLFPLKQNEININSHLVQNPGY